jgi:antitoxin (DNA-binding transcriptional repressor) of toxin-antitoxin stability system
MTFLLKDRTMSSIDVKQVQADLPAVIARLRDGEAVIIKDGGTPVARLTPEPPTRQDKQRRQPGSAVARLTIVSDDDEHLDDFAEYMP